MGKKIRLLVNYKNRLGLWNIGSETMVTNDKTDYIKPETFAQMIADVYMSIGCEEVICVEVNGNLTKKAMQDLGSIDISFISENFRKMLGKRWTFRKGDPPDTEEGEKKP